MKKQEALQEMLNEEQKVLDEYGGNKNLLLNYVGLISAPYYVEKIVGRHYPFKWEIEKEPELAITFEKVFKDLIREYGKLTKIKFEPST